MNGSVHRVSIERKIVNFMLSASGCKRRGWPLSRPWRGEGGGVVAQVWGFVRKSWMPACAGMTGGGSGGDHWRGLGCGEEDGLLRRFAPRNDGVLV